MQPRERLDKGTRREVERIQVAKNTKVTLPSPATPSVFNPGTKPVIASLTIKEKTGNLSVNFVKKIVVPDGKLIDLTNNTAELIFDTMPNGTIHQTLRHTGVGGSTWEATSRIETREATAILPAVSYEIGGVTIKGYSDDHPLLSIGSSAEGSVGWGQRVIMPAGTGVNVEAAGQNLFITSSATAPYCLKLQRTNTASEYGVLEVVSNSTYENAVNRGVYVSHNIFGIDCYIPSSVNLGNSTTSYGLKIRNEVNYSGTPITSAYGIKVDTVGKYKRGIRVDIADTGNLTDNRNNSGIESHAAGAGTRAAFFFGNGSRTIVSDAVVHIQAASNADYALHTEGMVNTTAHYRVNGTQVVSSRITGWGTPTGTTTKTAFDTSTVTLPQLAERVKALIEDLKTHGLIG